MTQHSSKRYLLTITREGKVTLPAAIRRHLGVQPNDTIYFVLTPQGKVFLTASKDKISSEQLHTKQPS